MLLNQAVKMVDSGLEKNFMFKSVLVDIPVTIGEKA